LLVYEVCWLKLFHCFDAVGWVKGRVSDVYSLTLTLAIPKSIRKSSFGDLSVPRPA